MNSAEIKKADPFLTDPDKISVYIKCIECRERLWRQDILKRIDDRVAATQTLPTGKNKTAFANTINDCPLCEKKFFAQTKKGAQMYLIEDAESGITRII